MLVVSLSAGRAEQYDVQAEYSELEGWGKVTIFLQILLMHDLLGRGPDVIHLIWTNILG